MIRAHGGKLGRVVVGLLVVACGVVGRRAAAQAIHRSCKADARGQAAACITEPREGGTVRGPVVKVVLASAGIAIAPVAQAKAGAAHYHLFLDVAVPATSDVIPQGPGVTHLGNGQKQYQLENVGPGLHRLIVVLGDNSHVPVARQKSDTAYFTVAAR